MKKFKTKWKMAHSSEDLRDVLRLQIAQNFNNAQFPKETQSDIQMMAIRNDLLFTNLGRFLY